MSTRAAKRAKSNSSEAHEVYGWKELNEDLNNWNYLGGFGGQNGVYQAVAEIQAGKDLNEHHCLRHDDEKLVPEIVELLSNPKIQENWDNVISFNPNGLWSSRPTIAATYARMDMPEIELIPDGQIVDDQKSIRLIKVAIEPAWNLPAIAERLKIPEPKLREKLAKYTQIKEMTDTSRKVFLPPIGGATVYFFGDPRKLADPKTQVAVRCHDECNGSDVFCTDICTCRPYLLFAIQGAVECAQRGGVGIVAYFRKEGRALGEVTKYRVYNARKNQEGGDRPETYFKQTENIAGIRDARLQELMPDVLTWLGIKRIDWLLSMSSDKYGAIVSAGIEVLQRVSLPDELVPRDATVEITAKISAGYHCEHAETTSIQKIISDITLIRHRSNLVYKYVQSGESRYFELDESKLSSVVDRVVNVMNRSYPSPQHVPYHSRARHFELPDGTDLVKQLYDGWRVDKNEKCRRLVDLFVVSVLTDAGAGTAWSYMNKERNVFSRSEGLAIASYELFLDGFFSSDRAMKDRVNSLGLRDISLEQLRKAYQITDTNKMIGLDGRLKKLHNLSASLDENPEFFGEECPRPGNMVDYILKHSVEIPGSTKRGVSVKVLWQVVFGGMQKCWPSKLLLGINGDVWHCSALKEPGKAGSDLVPFHKLPQWLVYSLIEVFERFLDVTFHDFELLTGLAEYRNGGLFIDSGVIKMKREEMKSLVYDVGAEVVVEWRALTIVLIDKLAEGMRKKLNLTAEQFPVAKVLQAGTWQAGREIAKELREDGSAPIKTVLDGSVF
eukprot:c15311_g1_i1.p1 GENE.c15311_g1_i1~~c15311_g1_i1.p1  ORF type:complete len:804 (-),score=346.94 c15311_g1_i1:76-2421(-)